MIEHFARQDDQQARATLSKLFWEMSGLTEANLTINRKTYHARIVGGYVQINGVAARPMPFRRHEP
jgi:hypothetical protein